jgi:probable addiction module antidote protein
MKVSELMEFDASKYLKDGETIRHYLAQAFEAGDPVEIQAALGDVAKAHGMSALARDSGIKREALYRALSDRGNAESATIMKVVAAMGLHLTLAAPEAAPKANAKTKAAPKTTTAAKKTQPAAKRARAQSGTVRARAGTAHA